MGFEAVWLWVFWCAVALLAYTHALYPALLIAWVGGRTRGRLPGATGDDSAAPAPFSVACVVAAYNEERHVAARVANFLAQACPSGPLKVYIGSDGSADATARILDGLRSEQVQVLNFPVNRGKASVLNDLVAACSESIVVFSDANTLFQPGAIEQLVRHFKDPSVGAVCGELNLLDASGNNQDSVYWRIEQALKRSEAAIGGLLGANGAIYAIRRELFKPLPADTIIDDFCVAMNVVSMGHRLVYEPAAVAVEDTPQDMSDEYQRRVRIGIGNYQAFARHPEYLTRTGWCTRWTYLSHKVLRWFSPHLMLAALLASALLAAHSTFQCLALFVQAVLYAGFFVWRRAPGPVRLPKFLNLLFFFFTLNWAFLVGFWRFMTGQYSGSWRRTERG